MAGPGDRPQLTPTPSDLGQTAAVPTPGAEHVGHLADPSGDQGHERLPEREQEGQGKGQHQLRPTRGDRDGPKLVAGAGAADVVDTGPVGELLAVADPGIGDDQHPGTGQLSPPAQVDVLAPEGHLGVEAVQCPEQARPHEDTRRRHGGHVGHGVVLLLVELSGFDHVVLRRESIDDVAHVLEPVRRVPLDQFRTRDAGVGSQRLGHQQADRIRGESHVVVTDQQEGGVDVGVEHGVGRRREPLGVGRIEDRGAGKVCMHTRDEGGVAGGVHHEHLETPVVLGDETLERLVEPLAGTVGDHDRQHRRGGITGDGDVDGWVGHDRGRVLESTPMPGSPRPDPGRRSACGRS